MRFVWPLAIFVLLVGLLAYGLRLDPKKVPSPLIGKPAPEFVLPKLHQPQSKLSLADMKGRVWVLNVWASWCVACRAEHAVITQLAEAGLVDISGLNYKDQPQDGRQWLQQFGDPYTVSLIDLDGRVGIDWGVYGVPETFIMGKDGLIKHKHIGPVTHADLQQTIIPLLNKLLQQS